MYKLISTNTQLPTIPPGQREVQVIGRCHNKHYELTYTADNHFYHNDRAVSLDFTPYVSHWTYLPEIEINN